MGKKIAIIGAGPAGIYAAAFLKNFDGEVHLFEQNINLGEKLRFTGGGRMNITNKKFGVDQFFSSNKNLLKNLFKAPVFKQREKLFKDLGVKYKWEGDRAILSSENAVKEVDRMRDLLAQQKNLVSHLNSRVLEARKQDDRFLLEYIYDNSYRQEFFDVVVLACGGMFRIKDVIEKEKIYKLPLLFGHTITDLRPVLCPIFLEFNPFGKLAGISVKAKISDLGAKISVEDHLLFTHRGISGPAGLDFTALYEKGPVEINFLPDVSLKIFEKEFNKMRKGKHVVRSYLKKLFPERVADFFLNTSGIALDMCGADLPKENFKNLSKTIFHFELKDFKFFGYKHAWTTKGGVPLGEVNVSTLESKLQEDLYFAGEILDVNGLCGGYNISFACISAKIVSSAILAPARKPSRR